MPVTPSDLAAIAARIATKLGEPAGPFNAKPPGPPANAKHNAEITITTAELSRDPLLRALIALGRVHGQARVAPMGRGYDITCPWVHEHSHQADNGTYYVPVRTKFKCQHGHCQHRTHEHLRLEVERMLREDSGGTVGLAHFEFGPIRLEDLPADLLARAAHQSIEHAWLADTIYLSAATKQKLWSINRRIIMDDDAFNEMWRVPLAPVLPVNPKAPKTRPDERMQPSAWYRVHGERRRADGMVHWPGEGPIMALHGRPMINTWRPPEPKPWKLVGDADVAPWLALVRHVIGDETLEEGENLELVLDWLAMALGSWDKPGWHVVITGPQGLGKDTIVLPVVKALDDMATEIAGSEITNVNNPWLAARFVQVNEMRQTSRHTSTAHDQMNSLKLWDNSRETVWINDKYAKRTEARNVFMLWITSNEERPLRLEPSDRRFLMLDRLKTPVKADLVADYLSFLTPEGADMVRLWLLHRWARMPGYRKAILAGRAPMTEAKQEMIDASNEDELAEWIDTNTPAWPDLVTTQQVHQWLANAIKAGTGGFSSNMRLPSVMQLGHKLAAAGWLKCNKGQPLAIGGLRTRVWSVRDHAKHVDLHPHELKQAMEAQPSAAGKDFSF